MTSSPLYGLYLTGGQSSRMGSPKWALDHLQGQRFVDHSTEQLAHLTEQVYLSTASPLDSLNPLSLEQICDDQYDTVDLGPLGGLLAAHRAHPEASWLVLACDLPAVSSSDLALLLAAATDTDDAVAFRNPIDGVPEATAALYRPSALRQLEEYLTLGHRCARKFLDALMLRAIDAPSPYMLQNTNYPADYQEWRARAEAQYALKSAQITVEFYAKLKQDAQTNQASVNTSSYTIAGLWEECRFRYNLSLKQPSVKPAVNNNFVEWNHPLNDGDLIAFMPPFAGG